MKIRTNTLSVDYGYSNILHISNIQNLCQDVFLLSRRHVLSQVLSTKKEFSTIKWIFDIYKHYIITPYLKAFKMDASVVFNKEFVTVNRKLVDFITVDILIKNAMLIVKDIIFKAPSKVFCVLYRTNYKI